MDEKPCWWCPSSGGHIFGASDGAMKEFVDDTMETLVREVCQNSLDARSSDKSDNQPVIVKFELVKLETKRFPLFEEMKKLVDSGIEFWSSDRYDKPSVDLLTKAKTCLESEWINVLLISDYNTTGLNGVQYGLYAQSHFNTLVNTDGVSKKQGENSGGSHGLGKLTPFGYSVLRTVFYNTRGGDGGSACQGVARLVTTKQDGEPTQHIWKYLYRCGNKNGFILPEHACNLRDQFKRVETGTDLAVIAFKTDIYENWEKGAAVAVLKNFIIAVKDGKLKVQIKSLVPENEFTISQQKIEHLLFHEFADEKGLKETRQIYNTVTRGRLKKTTILEKDDLSIYTLDDEDSITAKFRSTGMLINAKQNGIKGRRNVVLMVNDVGDMKLTKILRETEPPQHTDWNKKYIDDLERRKEAEKVLDKVRRAAHKAANEGIKNDVHCVDARIGDCIPALSQSDLGNGSNKRRIDVKIRDIEYDGDAIFSTQYDNALLVEGAETKTTGIKTGKKKRKRTRGGKITVVNPGGTGVQGVSSGNGKVKFNTDIFSEYRMFRWNGNKHRLFINASQNQKRVWISFVAAAIAPEKRQIPLAIKTLQAEGNPLIDAHGKTKVPIPIEAGENNLIIEFESNDVMAIEPRFIKEGDIGDDKTN